MARMPSGVYNPARFNDLSLTLRRFSTMAARRPLSIAESLAEPAGLQPARAQTQRSTLSWTEQIAEVAADSIEKAAKHNDSEEAKALLRNVRRLIDGYPE